MIHEWTLEISSWTGISLGAEHYFGKVRGPGTESVEIRYTPTTEQAARAVDKSHQGNEPSPSLREILIKMMIRDGTNAFWTEADLIAAAIAYFRATATAPAILVQKDHASLEAAPLIDAIGLPKAVVRRLKTLGERYKSAWGKYTIRKGAYFDLTPRGRAMTERAEKEYYAILRSDHKSINLETPCLKHPDA